MAFATRTDLTTYQPDIDEMGLSSSQLDTYVTQAISDVKRDIRNRWWSVYQANKVRDRSYIGQVEMDASLLTDAQWTRCTVYRCLGYYVCPSLTKFRSDNQDRFQLMMQYYRTAYEDEMQDILRDGVEYDQDNDNTVTNSEKEPLHTLRLVR